MNANGLLLTLIMSRSDQLLHAWCVLGVVGLAILAVAATNREAHVNQAIGRVLALGWLIFAVTHFMCMQWILKQWQAVAYSFVETPTYKMATESVKASLASVVTVPEIVWVLPFHLVFDAFVLIGLWWLTRTTRTTPVR
ncbi:hypothetical protein BH11PLA2_BH11PLA2_18690 [soil metagenome]